MVRIARSIWGPEGPGAVAGVRKYFLSGTSSRTTTASTPSDVHTLMSLCAHPMCPPRRAPTGQDDPMHDDPMHDDPMHDDPMQETTASELPT